ncbi:Dabb family protein [Oscillatoria laete-virens NRMC-F 0139]|nr:Dabb family protein [Oscillatoria laete-virens]MDL5053637.1 Dabb family protein [Oscillatoria laete-virens NRMC-F 0139]
MKVEHIVWFKWNEGVSAERIGLHLKALADLRHTVPGIVSLRLGKNFTDRAKGFTHGLVVTLENRAALPVYADHPAHMAVAVEIRKDAEVMAMDFEFSPAGDTES